MPARRNIIRSVAIEVSLPEDLVAKLQLHLFSQVEGRIPKGAYREFFTDRINEFFAKRAGERFKEATEAYDIL